MLPRAAVYFWFRIHFTLCRRPSQNPRYDTATINKHAAASAAKTRLLQLVKLILTLWKTELVRGIGRSSVLTLRNPCSWLWQLVNVRCMADALRLPFLKYTVSVFKTRCVNTGYGAIYCFQNNVCGKSIFLKPDSHEISFCLCRTTATNAESIQDGVIIPVVKSAVFFRFFYSSDTTGSPFQGNLTNIVYAAFSLGDAVFDQIFNQIRRKM